MFLDNNFNKQQFIGRLIADPVIKETATGKLLLTFTLAYSTKRRTTIDGSCVNFLSVELWEKLADYNQKKLKKGMKIFVKGEMFQFRWKDEEDNPRSKFKLTADSIRIIDLKNRPEPIPIAV